MTLEELKNKAKRKEITLEELEIEDILKFMKGSFLNPALQEAFDISLSEVNKIRKKKKLNDALFENLYRTIMVLEEYILETYPFFIEYFQDNLIITLFAAFGCACGKEELYLKKCHQVDWKKINPSEEIQKRKIDVAYRQKEYSYYWKQVDIAVQKYLAYQEEWNIKTKESNKFAKEYIPKKRIKKEKITQNKEIVPRDPKVSEHALERANYCCEINPCHSSFIRRKNHKRYMEPHHLIPLDFQDQFFYSLDVEANIVSLCSHCHNEIHYGTNYKILLHRLFEERKELLKECGIELKNIDELYQMYDKTKDKIEV